MPKMLQDRDPLPGWTRHHIADIVRRGGVIAYPTEGVWGLGCRPDHPGAISRILTLKKRPAHKGLIVVAAYPEQVSALIDWSALSLEQMETVFQSWPGPTTWLLPARPQVPFLLRGQHPSLAVRISAHPLVQSLCRAVGPLVSTSANHAGRPSALSALQVRRWFGDEIEALVPGVLGGRKGPSEIRDVVTGAVLR